MSLEIEYRAQLSAAAFAALTGQLRQRGEDLGPDNKQIWFYVLPDKLLKVVHNISQGTGKIALKTNRIGSGTAFPETELPIAASDVPKAIEIINALGFSEHVHDAYNERHNWRYLDVEIALKWSEAWKHHAEFEIVLSDEAMPEDIDAAEQRIKAVAAELSIKLMSEAELTEFTRRFEESQAAAKSAV